MVSEMSVQLSSKRAERGGAMNKPLTIEITDEKLIDIITALKRYEHDVKYIGTGEYISEMYVDADGEWLYRDDVINALVALFDGVRFKENK